MQSELDPIVGSWLKRLPDTAIKTRRLEGGINNKAYIVEFYDKKYVIKSFAQKKQGQADRMEAEISFLRYANEVATSFTPQLIDIDRISRSILIEFIEGSRYSSGQYVTSKDISFARDFIAALNQDLGLAADVVTMRASEGYSKLTEHLESIRKRIDSMGTEHLHTIHIKTGKHLLHVTRCLYESLAKEVRSDIKNGQISDHLDDSLLRISPSDFGFHNAMRTTRGVQFFDFEFAGWDDPAKLIVDFMLQPSIDVSRYGFCLQDVLGVDKDLVITNRVQALLPILQLKWITIVLGVMNQDRFNEIKDVQVPSRFISEVEQRFLRASLMIKKNTGGINR